MRRQHYRIHFILGWLTFCLVAGLSGFVSAAQAEDDPTAGLEILAQFNQWRLEVGLAPLKPSDTLHRMALDQATYLSGLTDIPGGNDMHLGSNGETLRERAARYDWTTYGEGGLAAVAEVGWVGPIENGIAFWKESDIHSETITNPGHREVGVAAVTHPWGHVFIVVLGSRPDVLPALADSSGSSLYLTQDIFKYGLGNVPPTKVHLFDADGRPLNKGQALDWAPMIPIPADTNGKVYVLYHDGNSQSLAEVDLVRDQAVLLDVGGS